MALSFILTLLLVGCSGRGNTPPPPCPSIVKIDDAGFLTKFVGESEDLTESEFEARIDGTKSQCYYTEEGIRTELSIQFSASRGPKFKGENVAFQYFIAITGPNQQPLAREVFDAEIDFSRNRVKNIVVDQVEPFIPKKDGVTGDSYRIYVGLILNEKQLAFNRKHSR